LSHHHRTPCISTTCLAFKQQPYCFISSSANNIKLETCIDDERQFKTAKRPQAPSDATVWKRFFHDNFVIFRPRLKRIAFFESVNFLCAHMQIFNFRDGNVTIFRHPSGAYICQMPGHRLLKLAKGIPADSQLSSGTIGLG